MLVTVKENCIWSRGRPHPKPSFLFQIILMADAGAGYRPHRLFILTCMAGRNLFLKHMPSNISISRKRPLACATICMTTHTRTISTPSFPILTLRSSTAFQTSCWLQLVACFRSDRMEVKCTQNLPPPGANLEDPEAKTGPPTSSGPHPAHIPVVRTCHSSESLCTCYPIP